MVEPLNEWGFLFLSSPTLKWEVLGPVQLGRKELLVVVTSPINVYG